MSVTFEGIIDRSLGGFVCIRGFSPFKELSENSEVNEAANAKYQRDLISEHKDEIKNFMDNGLYLFFPEVILSYTITDEEKDISSILSGGKLYLNDAYIGVDKTTKKAQLKLKDNVKLTRIDGNHRLSAYELNKSLYDSYNFPFCIIILNSQQESIKKENILFHNINFKQIPLTKEKSLEILFKDDVYSDDELKSMGVEYLITKKVLDEINKNEEKYNYLPFITYKHSYPKTFMYKAVEFLCKHSSVKSDYLENEGKVQNKILNVLENISGYYKNDYKNNGSCGMFSCLLYYEYEHPKMKVNKWFYNTDIYIINDRSAYCDSLDAETLKSLFDGIHDKAVKDIFKVNGMIGICSYLCDKIINCFLKQNFNKLIDIIRNLF